jgi:aminoglycoside phosphotransferase
MQWDEMPAPVRSAIEDRLGSRVVSARSQAGGFCPGVAARLRLADGARVFVKAVCGSSNPDSPAIHRREARVAAALPAGVPAPALRWSWDDGEWVVLAFDDVDGRAPELPWRAGELDRVLDALVELESRWPDAVRGDTLVHLDVRADNVLLTPDRVLVVDWPWAGVGASWLDLVAMLPSVAMQGGPAPDDVWRAHPLNRGVDENRRPADRSP